MQLSITGKQLDVGEALRSHIDETLGDVLRKYFPRTIDVSVIMAREGYLYRANISAHVGRGVHLESQGEADEPYPAFEAATEKLSKRLRRYKRRMRNHHKLMDGGEEVLPAQRYILSPLGGGVDTEETSKDSDDDNPVVVAEMASEVPIVTVSVALRILDQAELPALLFRNNAHGGLNMIYRRKDGNIGWIDPRGNRGSA